MSDERKKPTPVSVVPSLILFGISTVVTVAVMVLAMFYNHLGGF